MLKDYEGAVQRGGAIVLCVVGGKLSEGINFGDDLGRGVMVIGLPYPNRNSPELAEKLLYIEQREGGKSAAEAYYTNLCMKAVNQSIGRVIRHRNDYACVILADERYADDGISNLLPRWIQSSLAPPANFGECVGLVRSFFAAKRSVKS